VQVTVPILLHRFKLNSTFKHGNGENLNLGTSADVFIPEDHHGQTDQTNI
jgi:hypothetical protein